MSDSAVVQPGTGPSLSREVEPAEIVLDDRSAEPERPTRRGRLRAAGPALLASVRTGSGRLAWGRLILAGVSGFVLHLAFPGYDLWPLAPVAVAGLAIATRGVRARFGALLGFVFGLVFFLRLIPWIGIYVGAFPWVALSVTEALYLAVMGALLPAAWRVGRGRAAVAGLVLTSAGLWVGQEAVRGRWPFGGFPWGRLAFSQADAPTAALASIGGAPLVGFVVAAAGTLLAWAVVTAWQTLRDPARQRSTSWLRAVAAPGAGLAVAVAVTCAGALIPLSTDGESTAKVAAVQGNVPRAGLDFNAQRRAVLDNHVQATLDLAERVAAGTAEQPDIVLWPENSSDIDPYLNADAATTPGSSGVRGRAPAAATTAPTSSGIRPRSPNTSLTAASSGISARRSTSSPAISSPVTSCVTTRSGCCGWATCRSVT